MSEIQGIIGLNLLSDQTFVASEIQIHFLHYTTADFNPKYSTKKNAFSFLL